MQGEKLKTGSHVVHSRLLMFHTLQFIFHEKTT